jgi:pimeloyl-ACP methyl ester carboxylesterase
MLGVVAFVAVVALLLVIIALLVSPGRAYAVVDDKGKPVPGSLSEKVFVDINGVKQGMFIASANPANPVLLFVHGGPGMPEYWMTNTYPTGLENDFTVVWWDQRGSGLSYDPATFDTVTIDQLVTDTLAVTDFLRERFGKEKIYLFGHSGGSYIAIQAAARAPELYYAYIGVAQIGYQLRSERLAYGYMLDYYRKAGNEKMLRRLEAAPPGMSVPLSTAYDALRDDAMHGAGVGTTRAMPSVITGVFLPSWATPVYTIGEKLNLWRGKFASKARLRDTMFATDLTERVTEFKLPIYFLHGTYDYTCAYEEARHYFDKISAPVKGFYTFEQSAHSPMFEEPAQVRQILREDALIGATRLADQE